MPEAVEKRTCTDPDLILVDDSDRQIVAAVAVEIAGGERVTEEVVRLAHALDAGSVLVDHAAGILQPTRAAVGDPNATGVGVEAGAGDGEVGEAVAVEVARRQSETGP